MYYDFLSVAAGYKTSFAFRVDSLYEKAHCDRDSLEPSFIVLACKIFKRYTVYHFEINATKFRRKVSLFKKTPKNRLYVWTWLFSGWSWSKVNARLPLGIVVDAVNFILFSPTTYFY